MKNRKGVLSLALIAAGCGAALGAGVAAAETVSAKMEGFDEVPAVSTVATARFKARIDERGGSIFWELEYDGLQADATQAHIHFGQRHTNGGITVWLCGTATNPGPAGTQVCPPRSASLNGTITAANVLASAPPPAGGQQMPAGGFEQLVRAMRAGATYANVHTTASLGGEVRGQIKRSGHGRGHDHDHHDRH